MHKYIAHQTTSLTFFEKIEKSILELKRSSIKSEVYTVYGTKGTKLSDYTACCQFYFFPSNRHNRSI